LGSPGSTWAGLGAILAVVSGAVNHGIPVDVPGWIGFTLTIISGIGAIFSRA
jgi:multidrug transporter EmrE-like cation transporter